MRVLVAGSRSIGDYTVVEGAIRASGFEVTELIIGGTRQLARWLSKYAHHNDLPVIQFLYEPDKYGPDAGDILNAQMVDLADAVIAIWDGQESDIKRLAVVALQLEKHTFLTSPEIIQLYMSNLHNEGGAHV